jgi:Tol biopolymer transport system component
LPLISGIAGRKVPLGFSPDGRRLAFGTIRPGVGRSLWVGDLRSGETRLVAEQRRGIWNVYWVPLDGGIERQITSYDSPAVYVRSPDWSPLGDRIAYEYAESASTVWMTDLPPVRAPR